MRNLVARIYDTEQRAREAVKKLKAGGFQDRAILALLPGSADSVANAIEAGELMAYQAGFYADRVRNGRSVVAIDAPFGQGQRAARGPSGVTLTATGGSPTSTVPA